MSGKQWWMTNCCFWKHWLALHLTCRKFECLLSNSPHASSVIFHNRFLFACLKNGFPGVLDLKHREIPTGWRQTVGNPFFLNHNHGADLAFSPQQTKVHKRPIVSSLAHHALAVLFAMKTVTSQHLSWCLWYCVVQCVLLASSSSLEPRVETWCCPSQNGLRQNVSGHSDSCDFLLFS